MSIQDDIVRRANSWLYNNPCKGTVGNLVQGLVDEVKKLRNEIHELRETVELAEERAQNIATKLHKMRKAQL